MQSLQFGHPLLVPSKYAEYWMKLANLRRQLNLIDASLMSDQAFFLQYKNGLNADMIKKIMFDNDYEDNALDILWFHQFFQKQERADRVTSNLT